MIERHKDAKRKLENINMPGIVGVPQGKGLA
jgi:hypothetical protein